MVWVGAGSRGRSDGRVALYFREDVRLAGPPPANSKLEQVEGAPGLDLPKLESAQLAAAYGVNARRTTGVDDTREALREAIASPRPELVEVRVAPGMAMF